MLFLMIKIIFLLHSYTLVQNMIIFKYKNTKWTASLEILFSLSKYSTYKEITTNILTVLDKPTKMLAQIAHKL